MYFDCLQSHLAVCAQKDLPNFATRDKNFWHLVSIREPKRPAIHYLAASLDSDWKSRASMHAKLVIIDQSTVLLTSANLTRAAQTKNIEAGVIIHDHRTAIRLSNHFQSLVNSGEFVGM